MLEVDRQIKATLLRSIPILVAVAVMGIFYHYRPQSGMVADPEAIRELERIREGSDGEGHAPRAEPKRRFSGALTPEQKDALLRALSQAGKYSVDIIPTGKTFEGSSISPTASKAAADEFASLFWKAGWDARVFEADPHPPSRALGDIVLVINPDSTEQSPARGRKAAQILRAVLKQNGIEAEFYSSYKVDPETFEMHISINTASH